jgi:hypothetical protein
VKAGIQLAPEARKKNWTPAFAGVTSEMVSA